MSRHKRGFNDSLTYCQETCPGVDKAFSDVLSDLEPLVAPTLWDEVKRLLDMICEDVKEVGTVPLRDALCVALIEKIDVEAERDALQREVDALQQEVGNLSSQLDEVGA